MGSPEREKTLNAVEAMVQRERDALTQGALTGTAAKANPDAGPGFAHDFGCTHNPCVCSAGNEPLRTLRAAAELPPRELAEELRENDGRLPKRVSTSLRFPPELHEALTQAAEERGLSFNFLVVAAVREFLDRLLPADEIRYTKVGE